MDSEFPAELDEVFRGMETRGNPYGLRASARMDWAKGLDFPVPVVGRQVADAAAVDYLLWVGCAGALDDRGKATTRALAELLHRAGVSFAVLGPAESCTGDAARRAGNELLFQMMARQNIETLTEAKVTKIVASCAHCLNTLKNEYPQFGGDFDVVHHTQLLDRLVREGRLRPGAPVPGLTVTYHDPCYLGRHNGEYDAPRALLGAVGTLTEMPRTRESGFCCGGGGARSWVEESIGTRINVARTEEAVATGAGRIAVGCPFCKVMLADGLVQVDSPGVEVHDVAQLLLAAVTRDEPT